MSEPGGDWAGLEDRAAVPELPPGGKCRNHPDRPATAVCTECRAPVCDECAPLKGGGHVFCNSCMKNSRLVDAEPQIIGAPAEDAAGEPGPPFAAPVSRRARLVVLVVIALALAAAIAAMLLSSCNAPSGDTRQDDRGAPLDGPGLSLAPDPEKSFVTILGPEFLVGLLGDGWALQAYVPGALDNEGGRPAPGKAIAPRHCLFSRGLDLDRNVRPPQGVATMPLSMRTDCQTREVKDLKVSVLRVEAKGYERFVELKLSGFTAGGEKFAGIAAIQLRNRGPYP